MSTAGTFPLIIQGGMGVGVSNWQLARAVSRRGQLGVVSGTALDSLLVRRLQDGDPGGHMRRALEAFPIPEVSVAALRRYFLPEGRAPREPYKLLPMYKQAVSVARQQVTMLANFAEVYLAKEGHDGEVGINLLTKLQLPNLASLYGAMLAGVDYVLMGAGIPREIPGALDAMSAHQAATLRFDVDGLAGGEVETISFDPARHGADTTKPLARPKFLAIIAANSLATTLARKANGRVDGFIVEGPTAGGHNAPARGVRSSTRMASRSTASAMSSISKRCASSAFRSGWPEGPARPNRCSTRSRRAPPGFRSARCSRTAMNPGSIRITNSLCSIMPSPVRFA